MITWADIQPFLFLALAAVFKAVADTIAHHYFTSVFRGKAFFNPYIAHKKLPFTKYPFDGWHLSNSLMIVCFTVAVFGLHWKVLVGGVIFILVFNLFYNKWLLSVRKP